MSIETPQSGPTSGSARLRPRARLMRTIGDELISSEPVAIIEMIKTGYDADATRVLVRLRNLDDPKKTSIQVLDNGHGMELQTVLGPWLEPATSYKSEHRESPRFKRRRLGEKGIGRFAAARLGRYILLATRFNGQHQEAQILLDWQSFDNFDRFLEDIEILWQLRPPSEICPEGAARELHWEGGEPLPAWVGQSGTMIDVTESPISWSRSKLEDLRRSLERLMSPIDVDMDDQPSGLSDIDTFHIWLDVEGHEDLSGPVEPPEVLRRPDYRISGTIDDCGYYHLEVTVDNVFTRRAGLEPKTTADDGRFMFEVRTSSREAKEFEARRLSNHQATSSVKNLRMPSCGPLKIDLRVWDLDRDAVNDRADRQSLKSTLIRSTIKGASGVSVYRNGFRVLPYGEPNNDWLRLDIRRVNTPTMRVSANQVVGTVTIDHEKNSALKDQSNREGIVESTALEDFRALIRASMSILEESRYASRERRQDSSGQPPTLFARLQLDDLRSYAETHYAADSKLAELIAKKQEELADDSKRIQEVLARYRSLSVLGQLVDRVTHDIRGPLGAIKNKAELIERQLAKFGTDNSTNVKAIARIREILASINKAQEQTAGVVDSLARFGGRKRGKPKPFALEDLLADTAGIFKEEMEEKHVDFHISSGKTVITGEEIELSQVFANLLLNSMHWLMQVDSSNRKIQVDVQRDADGVVVLFSDSGPGVGSLSQPYIFDPYYSTREGGLGLGLTIVGEIVRDYYDGDVFLIGNGPLPGATFKLVLRRRIGHA